MPGVIDLPTVAGTIQVVADESVEPGTFEVRQVCPDRCVTKPCVHMRKVHLDDLLEEIRKSSEAACPE